MRGRGWGRPGRRAAVVGHVRQWKLTSFSRAAVPRVGHYRVHREVVTRACAWVGGDKVGVEVGSLDAHAWQVMVGTQVAEHLLLPEPVVVGGGWQHLPTWTQPPVTIVGQARADHIALPRFHFQLPALQRREGVVKIRLLLRLPRNVATFCRTWTRTTLLYASPYFPLLLLQLSTSASSWTNSQRYSYISKNVKECYLSISQSVLLFETLPSSEEGAVVEHVVAVWVKAPVAALAWLLVVPGHLHEALVQRKVVSDGVLPTLRFELFIIHLRAAAAK